MKGQLAECTTSNIFLIKDQLLQTPAVECGILVGITRDVVMELAEGQDLTVEEGSYSLEQLLHADECFITNTGFEIMPVSKIGNTQIGQGKKGPWTHVLCTAFRKNLNRYLGPSLTS